MVMRRSQSADPPRMVPVREASRILHVHPNTLRKWSDEGLIPSCRIGHRRDRRFAVEDLLTFLAQDGNGTENHQEPAEVAGDSS